MIAPHAKQDTLPLTPPMPATKPPLKPVGILMWNPTPESHVKGVLNTKVSITHHIPTFRDLVDYRTPGRTANGGQRDPTGTQLFLPWAVQWTGAVSMTWGLTRTHWK